MRHSIYLSLLLAILLLGGCKQKYALFFNPPVGTEYTQQIVKYENFLQNRQTVNSTKTVFLKYTVTGNGNSAVTTTAKYTKLSLEQRRGDPRHNFEEHFSSDLKIMDKPDSLSLLLESITEIPLNISFNKQGKLVKTDGFDVIEFTLNGKGAELKVPENDVKGLINNFTELDFVENYLSLGLYPDRKVALSEKWQHNFVTASINSPEIYCKCTAKLKEVVGNMATVSLIGAISLSKNDEPDTDSDEENSEDNETSPFKLKGTISGSFFIDISTGFIIEGAINVKMQGYVSENRGRQQQFSVVKTWRVNTIPLNGDN